MAAWRASHTKLSKLLRGSATSSQLSLQKAILNASAQGDAQGIIQVLLEGQSIMSAVNVATAAHRLAKLRPRKSLKERSVQQLQADVDLISDTLTLLKCQTQNLKNLIHMAGIKIRKARMTCTIEIHVRFIDFKRRKFVSLKHQFFPLENIDFAIAWQVPILLAQKEFGSQATANTIWALAVLGCKDRNMSGFKMRLQVLLK